MQKSENELINDFLKLRRRKYISFDNSYSAGINLEKILNKSGGCFNIPDFDEFEIKTIKFNNPFSEIELFSSRADGPYPFPMQVISKKYGYPDKDFKNIKVLKGSVYGNKMKKIGLFYYYKLDVDYEKERVKLAVYNWNLEFIGYEAFWDFDSLLEKLNRKMQYLALFNYKSYMDNSSKYFWYNKLEIYKLKNDVDFLKLIENGKINIAINCGVIKSGKYIGHFIDHGTSFIIEKKYIEELFEKIRDL